MATDEFPTTRKVTGITRKAALAEARNIQTPGARLVELLDTLDRDVQIKVCSNPNLPKAKMVSVARGGIAPLRRGLARNPGLFKSLQKLMAKDKAPGIVTALAGNPILDNAVIEILCDHQDWRVRAALARRKGLSLKAQLILAKDQNVNVRCRLAENAEAAPAALDKLAFSSEESVLRLVAESAQTGAQTLDRLCDAKDFRVLWMVASNKNTPESGLNRLVANPNNWSSLLLNPRLPAGITVVLAEAEAPNQADGVIRQHLDKLLAQPNLPEGWQLKLGLDCLFDWRMNRVVLHCRSKRVRAWLQNAPQNPQAMSFEQPIVRQEGEVYCERTGGGVRVTLDFSEPREANKMAFWGKEVPDDCRFGWWEPEMEDKWLCWVRDRGGTGEIAFGQAQSGAHNMQNTRNWTRNTTRGGEEIIEIFEHGVWEVKNRGEGLEAKCWVRAVPAAEVVPELPNLKPKYTHHGTAFQRRGVLLYQGALFALWMDKGGHEAGWEALSEMVELDQADRLEDINLVKDIRIGDLPFKNLAWDGFEQAVRSSAFGRSL